MFLRIFPFHLWERSFVFLPFRRFMKAYAERYRMINNRHLWSVWLVLLVVLATPGIFASRVSAEQVQVMPISSAPNAPSQPSFTSAPPSAPTQLSGSATPNLPAQPGAQTPTPSPVNIQSITPQPKDNQAQQPPQAPVPQPGAMEKSSEFEQYLAGIAPAMISTSLKQFGYDLFSQPSSTFAAAEKVPVGPDYVIGPGDEIKISVWGSIEGQWTVTVERDGTVSLPKVGTIGVTGLTFHELKETLHKEISKYYTGFEMNVSLGALRTVRVYVVGNANRPGAYTLSSLATLVSALFEVGGPSKTGTMRDIRVERKGRTVAHFDVYEFLLKGDKTKDIRLMPEDVIFIPPVGPLVGIAGSVHNPAIYELRGEQKISQLIEMAGGLSTVAFKGRVQIERIVDNRARVVFESDLDAIRGSDLAVQAGDLVKIFAVVQDKKLVRLSGAVKRGGEFGYSPGMTVKDLIMMAGGLEYFAYNKEAELTRVSVTNQGPQTQKIMIDLQKALQGEADSNIALQADDYLFIRTVPEWRLYQTVAVTGEVKFPGTYSIRNGEKLSSLIERAGGYTDAAYLRGSVLVRESVRALQQKGLEEMAARLERELLVGTSVASSTSTSAEEIQAKKVEMEAQQKFIAAIRNQKATGRLVIQLAHLRLLKGSEYDIELEDGDSLYIPPMKSVVNVIGSVMSQGSFVYAEKLGYQDYVGMSGGYSRFADTDNVYVLKVDGSARKLSRGLFAWNDGKSRWEVSAFGEKIRDIEPGDTIIVPEKLDRIAWLREIKDITQILMQLAVTAGVVIELF